MTIQVPRLCGEDWQNWANRLLTVRYGPVDYQRIPDKDKGDAGIEGFAISQGHAFQAYGCEEPISTAERLEKQRDKMTRDIGKFIKNQSLLGKIFGTIKITRWALFVPYCDSKQVVLHASKKTTEVVQANLPYVANEFRVVVCQEDDYIVERDQLISSGVKSIQLSPEEATPEQVTKWVTTNDSKASALEDKLERLPTLRTQAERRVFYDKVLKWYLEGQTILEALRKYPDVFEKVVKAKSHREQFLAMATVSGSTPQQILTSSLQGLLETLKEHVRELHSYSAESLAHEAIADWLLRCPLDFPDINNG